MLIKNVIERPRPHNKYDENPEVSILENCDKILFFYPSRICRYALVILIFKTHVDHHKYSAK